MKEYNHMNSRVLFYAKSYYARNVRLNSMPFGTGPFLFLALS